MKKLILGILALTAVSGFAQTQKEDDLLTILATCNQVEKYDGEQLIVIPKEFLFEILQEKLGDPSAAELGEGQTVNELTVANSHFIYEKSDFFSLKISLPAVIKHNLKNNKDLASGTGHFKKENGLEELQGLGDFLDSISMGLAGACDFFVPTRLDVFSRLIQTREKEKI